MIDVQQLTKRYGATTAVDDLSFTVRPGLVTGFLGPNGAGKTTTMRMILGLDRPTAGRALVDGRPLADHPDPIARLGSLIEAKAVHPRRSARDHLRALAATTGITDRRVDEVLELVGLTEVSGRAAGGFSLGMAQRLGIATALLGDPATVMLDEPVNGLDPEGIVWIRHLLRGLAAEGRTVFVSSHLMSEMALTADHFIIVGQGRLLADVTRDELASMGAVSTVFVRTPDGAALRAAVAAYGVRITDSVDAADGFDVTGIDSDTIGRRAAARGVALLELTPRRGTLEETFMDLTRESVEYHAHTTHAHTTHSHPITEAA
ncbi:MAG: ABC transporter ATP-binding protein [Acidimicrobiales bacterium]